MTDFQTFSKLSVQAQLHENEIRNTRVGGLGGSDADIVLRISKYGVDYSTAALDRLAVMLGLKEQEDWQGNAYTIGGHKFEQWFEDWLSDMMKRYSDASLQAACNGLVEMRNFKREEKLTAPLANKFSVFAHADFTSADGKTVIECKFVNSQKDTAKVAERYNAQLQWYYMLGAERVIIAHGWGAVDGERGPGSEFCVEGLQLLEIERDEKTIDALHRGLALIDDALSRGWQPVSRDRMTVDLAPEQVQEAYADLATAKGMQKHAAELEKKAKDTILDYMEAFGYCKLSDVVYTAPHITSRFSADKLQQQLAEAAEESDTIEIAKVFEMIENSHIISNVAGSITYKQSKK